MIDSFNHGIDTAGSFLHIGLPHIPRLATGGVVNQPTLAVVGEAGPEAVVPLGDPGRAQQVMKEAGLLDMSGWRQSTNLAVQVFLGTREIMDIVDARVVGAMDQQGQALAFGTR